MDGRSSEQIQALTRNTVVITHKDGPEQQIPTAHLVVQAGMYPASTGILRVGERVSLISRDGQTPILIVHPVAWGTLAQPQGHWQITSRCRGPLAISGNPVLLGMKQLAASQEAAAFGTVSQGRVEAAAVAAKPLFTKATVQSTQSGQMTLQTARYGNLTYATNAVPSRVRQRLSTIPTGMSVVAVLDPLSHRVLMVWPSRTTQMAQALSRGSAGQVIAVSAKDLTLTNELGTVTIPVRTPHVEIRWTHHQQTTIQQIPPGTRIIAFRGDNASLKIVVLSAH